MFCFSSCQDAKLAEQLDGTWHTSYMALDEDGVSYPEEQDVKFTHIKSDSKYGGRFVERVSAEINTEENDVSMSYKLVSTISGEWEIFEGDLYMEYNLSSLGVEIQNMSVDNALFFSLLGIDFNNMVAKEIRKSAYHEMYKTYQSSNKDNDNGYCFLDLSVDGNTMSYSTADLGRMEWVRK